MSEHKVVCGVQVAVPVVAVVRAEARVWGAGAAGALVRTEVNCHRQG